MDIKFTNVFLKDIDLEKPQPASSFIPEWYRSHKTFIDSKNGIVFPNGNTDSSIKKCMPVFDAITSGYMILAPSDTTVSVVDDKQYFIWSKTMEIAHHTVKQAKGHPLEKPYDYPKFVNPWAIETPKGYSCLFLTPMHQDLPFTIFPGVVDTDSFQGPVNFPFVINDPQWQGIIPKGTPIAQVIPFKRDSWTMKYGNEKDVEKVIRGTNKLGTMYFNKYKKMFWNKKQYK